MNSFEMIAAQLPDLIELMTMIGVCLGFLPIVLVSGLCSVIELFKVLVKW